MDEFSLLVLTLCNNLSHKPQSLSSTEGEVRDEVLVGPTLTARLVRCTTTGDGIPKSKNRPSEGQIPSINPQFLMISRFTFKFKCTIHFLKMYVSHYLRWGKLKMAANSVHYVIPCIRMGKHVHSKTLTKSSAFQFKITFLAIRATGRTGHSPVPT